MKRFFCVLLTIAIVVFLDIIVGAFSRSLIINVPDVGVNQTNAVQALFYRDADILILGASRANHSYNCQIMEDYYKTTVYNAGRDGQNIIYAAMIFYSYLQKNKPSMIIIDISQSQIDSTWNSHLNEMNCFYGMSNSVDSIIRDVYPLIDIIKLQSNLYRYNNTWQWLLQAQFAKSQASLDGYRPMAENKVTNFHSVESKSVLHIDSLNMKYLERIVKTCEEKHIKLVLSYTPSLNIDRGEFQTWLKNFAKHNSLLLVNYAYDVRFNNHPELFYDMTHLNRKGADFFTRDFIKKNTYTFKK